MEELTKKCAEKMGLEVREKDGTFRLAWESMPNPSELAEHIYDPLHDDAQDMAMVKKFKLILKPNIMGQLWIVSHGISDPILGANLNRAICECVAAL